MTGCDGDDRACRRKIVVLKAFKKIQDRVVVFLGNYAVFITRNKVDTQAVSVNCSRRCVTGYRVGATKRLLPFLGWSGYHLRSDPPRGSQLTAFAAHMS